MEVAISNLVQTAIYAVTNLLNEPKGYILNAKDDLEKLQMKLKKFQKEIKDADLKPFFSKERDRVLEAELKDVLYDAEDIIQGYQSKIEASKRDQVRKRSWTTAFTLLTSFCEDFLDHYQLGNKIKKINERLEKIEKDWDMVYRLKPTPKTGGENPVHGEHDNLRETTHHMGVQPPTGRGDDKKEIVKRLLSNDSTKSSKTQKGVVSIISIVGKGGIGKTTLAKMVYKETEEHFGKRRWWVCVSKRPNRKDLLLKILKEVQKESKEGVDSSLSELCTQLRNELSKKKFLLVLDDVWEVKWWEEEVGGALMAGAMGSKILITSRNKNVSDELHASYMHELREFNLQQSWALFLNVALRKGQTEQDLVMHNIKEVGVSIVKKCGGLPLVIKTVGSMMLTKQMNREDWKSIEDSKIWEWKTPAASSSLSEIGGDILPGLILSYDDLPYHLKSCFVYCCIHPKDYEIEREILIMQWVAHGLIEEKKHIDVEATANQYIQDLIRRCLIEENNKSYYASPRLKLHDILYDLASYIGGEEYSHASTSQRTRHMSILAIDNVKEAMHNATTTTHKLRTLLTKSLPLVHLTNFKWLRMLSLMEYRMEELPNSIGDLALLKYLDLSWSHVRRLPTSIDTLCSLQTLDLSHSRIEELPKEMGELCNLRYLGLEGTLKLKFIAEGFGKLTNLRTLHRFLVCNDKKDTKGCNIWEIKDLKKLKGKLSIEGLGRSRNAIDHVGNAKLLKEKHGIISLEFDFGITGDEDKESGTSEQSSSSEQSGVLEALEPPVGLECLTIRYYKGKVPAGLSKTDCYTMLRSLKVIDCPALREIASTPALESLVLHGCNWEGWPAGGSEETTFTSMRSLRVANFRNCPKMQTQGLIDELAGLQRLIVRDCPSARLGWKLLKQLPNLIVLVLDSESAVLVPSPLPSQVSTFLPSLKELCLIDNTNVDGLKWGRVPEWVWGLSQLEILHLYSFSGDISLGGHWQCLPKLRSLWLFDFPNLKFVVEVNNVTPQQQQNGTTCPSDAQQQQIACLSNLHSLWIHSCPALELPQELNDHLGERIVKD